MSHGDHDMPDASEPALTAAAPLSHVVLAIAVVAIWGSNFVVAHWALQQFPPLMVATLRFALSALPWVLFVRPPAAPWRDLAAYGVLVGVGQFGLLYIAMQHDISPGLASLVMQMQAFFTVGLALWLLGEQISRIQILALALAATGLALVATMAQHSATSRGLLLTLLSALCWACANLIVKRAGRVNALAYIVWSSLFAVPPLLGLTFWVEGWRSMVEAASGADAAAWAAIFWQAFGNGIFGFGVWSWLLARHPAATVTPTSMLVPVFGLGASAVLLGEPLPAWKIAAALLVLAGLALNVLRARFGLSTPSRSAHADA
jgi:O-acetylserine/cysteine efflux transporter